MQLSRRALLASAFAIAVSAAAQPIAGLAAAADPAVRPVRRVNVFAILDRLKGLLLEARSDKRGFLPWDAGTEDEKPLRYELARMLIRAREAVEKSPPLFRAFHEAVRDDLDEYWRLFTRPGNYPWVMPNRAESLVFSQFPDDQLPLCEDETKENG